MVRRMTWRERLAARRGDSEEKRPAGELTKPTKGGFVSFGSAQDGHIAANDPTDLRAHLLNLAESEGVDAAHVHRLHADDVAACAGESDDTLRAYLRGLAEQHGMDAGIVPPGWTTAAHCEGCGPVWLWPDAARVRACPWCFRRNAGKRIPRPAVQCGDCVHYLPDPLNPGAGMGGCALGPGRAYWPMRRHTCGDMRPP
jgi:hypothetical protein